MPANKMTLLAALVLLVCAGVPAAQATEPHLTAFVCHTSGNPQIHKCGAYAIAGEYPTATIDMSGTPDAVYYQGAASGSINTGNAIAAHPSDSKVYIGMTKPDGNGQLYSAPIAESGTLNGQFIIEDTLTEVAALDPPITDMALDDDDNLLFYHQSGFGQNWINKLNLATGNSDGAGSLGSKAGGPMICADQVNNRIYFSKATVAGVFSNNYNGNDAQTFSTHAVSTAGAFSCTVVGNTLTVIQKDGTDGNGHAYAYDITATTADATLAPTDLGAIGGCCTGDLVEAPRVRGTPEGSDNGNLLARFDSMAQNNYQAFYLARPGTSTWGDSNTGNLNELGVWGQQFSPNSKVFDFDLMANTCVDDGSCTDHTGEYVKVCGFAMDGECAACDAACSGEGNYESTPCSDGDSGGTNANRVCTACNDLCDQTDTCTGAGADECSACSQAGTVTFSDSGTCTLVQNCTSSQYQPAVGGDPTSTTDRVCYNCDSACNTCDNSGALGCTTITPEGGGDDYADCAPGHWSDAGGFGFFECKPVRDVCSSAADSATGSSSYYSIGATLTSNRMCGPCNEACDAPGNNIQCTGPAASDCNMHQGGTYAMCATNYTSVEAPAGTFTCEECGECAPQQGFMTSCTTDGGLQCSPFVVECDDGEYETSAPSPYHDRVCGMCNAACTTCTNGTTVCSLKGDGSGVLDCADGHFENEAGQCVAVRGPCTTQDFATFYIIAATATSDRSCGQCASECATDNVCTGPTNLDCKFEGFPPKAQCNTGFTTKVGDAEDEDEAAEQALGCFPCNTCDADEFVDDVCTTAADTVCTTCDAACNTCTGPSPDDCTIGQASSRDCSPMHYTTEGGRCVAWSPPCEDGWFEQSAPGPGVNEDRVCTMCDEACNTCDGATNADCLEVTDDAGDLAGVARKDCAVSSQAPFTLYYDNSGVCSLSATECPDEHYMAGAATAIADLDCVECTECTANQNMVSACFGEEDTVCVAGNNNNNGGSSNGGSGSGEVEIVDIVVEVTLTFHQLSVSDIDSEMEGYIIATICEVLDLDCDGGQTVTIASVEELGVLDGDAVSADDSTRTLRRRRAQDATGVVVVVRIEGQAPAPDATTIENDILAAVSEADFISSFASDLSQRSGLSMEDATPSEVTADVSGAAALAAAILVQLVAMVAAVLALRVC